MVVKRIVVGAHFGMREWLAQRVTAAFMAIYCIMLGGALMVAPPVTYGWWRDFFAQGWMRVATLLFAGCLVWHAYVGVRDILMDYVKADGLRFVLQMLNILVLAAYLGWTIQILWR